MKSDLLFDAIGELPDEYVQDARPAAVLKRKTPWGVWVAAAACLVIAVLIAVPVIGGMRADEAAPRDTEPINELADEPVAETSGVNYEPVSEEKRAEANPEEPNYTVYGDPTSGGSDSSEIEFPAGAVTEAEFEEYNLALYSSMVGGEYTYEMYLEGFERAIENPVFDALLNDGGTERFFASSTYVDNRTQMATIYVNGLSTVGSSLSVHIEHSDVYFEQDWKYFEGTGDREVEVTEYEVDGVEIQKYFMSDIYYARIMIDGEWYLVTGVDEVSVDETMAELARIANEL